jgi:hypothetical protein
MNHAARPLAFSYVRSQGPWTVPGLVDTIRTGRESPAQDSPAGSHPPQAKPYVRIMPRWVRVRVRVRILNRYLKADLSCSPINGRHQRGSRRQMAACPRPARLGSCGGRRPAVTQPKRALASAVNPTTGSSPTAVSSWTATWSAPASRCSVTPAATVPASP